ncbi:MAG: ISNCY family transposase, partial [Methylobacter sp.]
MQQAQGRNNANSIFGVHKIPSDAQIRNLLDPVPPCTLFPVISDIGSMLFYHGYLDGYRSIGNTFL